MIVIVKVLDFTQLDFVACKDNFHFFQGFLVVQNARDKFEIKFVPKIS